jgi:hypothetical protein
MAIYFASNRLGQFGASSSAITEVLTSGRFDSSVVQSAISIPAMVAQSLPAYISSPVGIDATSVTTVYASVDFYFTDGNALNTAGPDAPLISWVNNIGQTVAQLVAVATVSAATFSVQFEYWNGSSFTAAGPAIGYSVNGLYTLNTRLTCGAAGSVDIWLGAWGAQALVCSVLPSSGLNAAVNNVAAVRFQNPTRATGFLSGVMLADFDLRARRLASDTATGEGVFTDGTGAYTDVNAFPRDLTTSRVVSLSGNKFSMTKAARTLPGNMQIDYVLINSALRAQGGVVTNARPGLSIGGVWYPFDNVNPVPNGGYENRASYEELNPATLARFSTSEYNSAQFGLEART